MRIATALIVSLLVSAACSDSNSPTSKPSHLASIKIVGGTGQTAPEGTTLPESIAVVATDSNGNPGVHLAVAWGPSGGGSTPSLTAYTDNTGRAATVWTLDTIIGQQSLLVSVADSVNLNEILTDTVYATSTNH
jgi:hypothetical protein